VRSRFLRIFWTLVLLSVAYLSLYTWNWRTGHLDQFTARTGLEFVGWVLAPGTWVQQRVSLFWERYVYHVGLSRENEALRSRLTEFEIQVIRLRESEAQASRLRAYFSIAPPEGWNFEGANVIGQRMGPNAMLDTLLVDKGKVHGISENTPVCTHQGVVGRVHKRSSHFATVLLITDPNSRIAVINSSGRTPGILVGDGPGKPLQVLYVPLNADFSEGDILITSGVAGIFPKGFPAARITRVMRESLSLFLHVSAEPLVDLTRTEEVMLLKGRVPSAEPHGDVAGPQGG
jgi:rod shape-determining protein MreC